MTNELTVSAASMPLPADLAAEYNLSMSDWRVIVDQLYPSAKSNYGIAMALAYCKSRNLDIMKRPVHIVPMYSSALKREVETVWPGIAEIRTTAARTGEYGGIDAIVYGPTIEREFVGEKDKWENQRKVGTEKVVSKVSYPEWASVVVYRWVKGEKAAFHCKIRWTETYARRGKLDVPNDMWSKRPFGQLDKCLEAAALRMAFPEEVGSMYAAEEMEGRTIEHAEREPAIDRKPAKPSAPPPPAKKSAPKPPAKAAPSPEPQKERLPEKDEPFPGDIEDASFEELPEESTPDSVAEGIDGDGEEASSDSTEYFDSLDKAMSKAKTVEEIQEIWLEADAEATLSGSDTADMDINIAFGIRERHLKRVKGKQ